MLTEATEANTVRASDATSAEVFGNSKRKKTVSFHTSFKTILFRICLAMTGSFSPTVTCNGTSKTVFSGLGTKHFVNY